MIEPIDQQHSVELVKQCFENGTPVYPVGGGCSLDYGTLPTRVGCGMSLTKLNRILDYPARDMTITVEAGTTMGTLADTLAKEHQRLPIDVPSARQATLGGVVATNFNGPRRYGQGSVRDYVIGISAVDGRGVPFKGGGRVVKNVAGYDFCKLLTGSLGTLGVITQLTLKLRPIPERLAMVVCQPSDLASAENLLSKLVHSEAHPAAIELLSGPAWEDDPFLSAAPEPAGLHLLVALEGTEAEVTWMVDQLAREWRDEGVQVSATLDGQQAADLMQRLIEFPAAENSPLVLKASVVPSATTDLIASLQKLDLNCSIQAHAGNGIVIARLSEFSAEGLSRSLVGGLQAAASAHNGNVVVLSNRSGAEMTHQSTWGGSLGPIWLMDQVKRKFDPKDILNPDRFVYQRT